MTRLEELKLSVANAKAVDDSSRIWNTSRSRRGAFSALIGNPGEVDYDWIKRNAFQLSLDDQGVRDS